MKYLLIIFASIALTKNTSAQLKGNGHIDATKIELDSFTIIENSLSSSINIKIGDTYSITVKTDKNLLNAISIQVEDSTLKIDQKEWISASRQVEIEIITTSLTEFINSAHGIYSINGLKGKYFKLIANVGDVVLSGTVNSLIVNTRTGDINAFEMTTQKAEVEIESFGTVRLNVEEELIANISKNGKIVLLNEVSELKTDINEGGKVVTNAEDMEPRPVVSYINVKLRNNSLRRVKMIFQGPEDARFSYGASMGMFRMKNKRFPIGTKVYLDNNSEEKRLLLEITAEDDGKILKLYN